MWFPETTQNPSSPARRVLDGYQLGHRLDDGKSNEVYEATAFGTEQRVVIRFLTRALGLDPRTRQKNLAEVALIGHLRHPHIASLLMVGCTADGVPYLVRERLAGETLASRLRRQGPVSPRVTVGLVNQIASALDAVHNLGLIHGELRPAKVFLEDESGDPGWFVKLAGFGLWRLHSDRQGPGAMANIARYTSPELTEGAGTPDGRTDQFSLAALAYRLLAGADAFPGDDVAAVLQAVLAPAPRSLVELGAATAAVDGIIRRGLSRRPADRFASAGEFARALEEAVLGPPSEITKPVAMNQIEEVSPVPVVVRAPARRRTPHPARSAARPHRSRGRSLMLLVFLLGVTAAAGWWSGWRPPRDLQPSSMWQSLRLQP
jgi:serine/threonine protein kinase